MDTPARWIAEPILGIVIFVVFVTPGKFAMLMTIVITTSLASPEAL
jgi:hypothetical protein